MYSIGQLSKLTHCKIPTIRYYEQIGLLEQAMRSAGNQRRYNQDHLQRLAFIRHSRALGFNLEEIKQLIHLQTCAAHSPHEAHQIAQTHLIDVQQKIKQLQALETELKNMVGSCHQGDPYQCQVLAALNELPE
ncbi:transcriptional regulator [Alteromonadales bacterium alter-6D02]|nr:transcriptional regulator [Alteromonadales bacterium alter-6D02]